MPKHSLSTVLGLADFYNKHRLVEEISLEASPYVENKRSRVGLFANNYEVCKIVTPDIVKIIEEAILTDRPILLLTAEAKIEDLFNE